PRERHAAPLEVPRHRTLALVVGPRLEQASQCYRIVAAAQDLVEWHRRGHRRRGRAAPIQPTGEAPVEPAAHLEAAAARAHGILNNRRAFSLSRAARNSSFSPRSSATRAAVSAK